MDVEKRATLKKARERFIDVDVADWLDLDESDRKVVELRVALVKQIRHRRDATGISQAALAKRIGTAQPNIAKIEAGGIGISLDLLMRVFFATGGRIAELSEAVETVV
jgi:ribosome-binding protein aMBF1 (putative translation factor)